MKILIAYDGSDCSDAALDDLRSAGLPEKVEAVVMSVAEVWLPPPPENETLSEYVEDLQTHPQPFKAYKIHAEAVAEAETLAKRAENRLQQNFPAWQITAEANYGSPAWEIITKASDMKADLIVVGSHGRSAVGRFFLGSISNKVLTEANCSVRVARGKIDVEEMPSRVIIGYDGSPGANAAVEAVASRHWHEQSEFKLVVVSDSLLPAAIGRFIPPIIDWVEDEKQYEREWIEEFAAPALQILKDANCAASLQIVSGNPKDILVEEATRWHADCIFVGANRFGSSIERFLLGSTAAAVAARASCSVEIIRKKV